MVNLIFGKKNEQINFYSILFYHFSATYCAAAVATLCQLEELPELFQNTAEWVVRYYKMIYLLFN